jgi:hypothetical protein
VSVQRKHLAKRWLSGIAVSAGCLLLALSIVSAQSTSAERTFHASKSDVQKALHDVPSYPGGKLPVLDGFADPAGHSLDDYKRGYYEYEVQLKSTASGDTTVAVITKITAWYAGSSPASSGYRLLKSSGRLESDLLDSLDDKLNPTAAKSPGNPVKTAAIASLPDTPSASPSFFNTPRLTTAPSQPKPASVKITDPTQLKRAQALKQEAENLQQILQSQTRPSDLAVVKRDNTPVLDRPLDGGAEVLFQASAEDEFQVLDTTEGWVHIQISGLSRGWIKRDYLDLPGAATLSVAAMSGDQHDRDQVRQVKEEVASFPGKWEALDGKQVEIIWVQPLDSDNFGSEPKWSLAKSVFRRAEVAAPGAGAAIDGVVVIFDSQDGGMAATTLATLQQWRAGHLPDEAFFRRSWRDPPEAFR